MMRIWCPGTYHSVGGPLAKGSLSAWVSTLCRVGGQVRPAAPALRKERGVLFPVRTGKVLWGCADRSVLLSFVGEPGLWQREPTSVCLLPSHDKPSGLCAVSLPREWPAADLGPGLTPSSKGEQGSSCPIQYGTYCSVPAGADIGLELPDPRVRNLRVLYEISQFYLSFFFSLFTT